MNVSNIIDEGRRLSESLDKALRTHAKAVADAAHAEVDFKHAWAKSYLRSDGPVKQREATADAETAELRRGWLLADGVRVSALEAIRSRRQQISLLQSEAAAFRAEAEVGAYGPQ